uniref:Uncharacterized protein n=1 Tax=Rhizophora mucronata TaxID=61149 RepID=A0A2P2IKL5_RHIMU
MLCMRSVVVDFRKLIFNNKPPIEMEESERWLILAQFV